WARTAAPGSPGSSSGAWRRAWSPPPRVPSSPCGRVPGGRERGAPPSSRGRPPRPRPDRRPGLRRRPCGCDRTVGHRAVSALDRTGPGDPGPALPAFFQPGSVAVIGAARDPSKVGGSVLANLLAAGFAGRIVPVNPHATTVQGLPAAPSLLAVDGPVDLAVIAVPAPA